MGIPWLPMDDRHIALAADAQASDPAAVLNFAKDAIALRRSSSALRQGGLSFLDAPQNILAFTREHDEERLFCVFNLGGEESILPDRLRPQGAIRLATGVNPESGPDMLPGLSGFIAS